MDRKFNRIKYACYSSNISMAVVGNFSPLLFLTFRSQYGISYSLLGLLVLINFCTQLSIDLVFSFFSHKFNISKTVKSMPVFTFLGLLIFALWPMFMPESAYIGIVIGTILFSTSSGLSEVLISPIIDALPSKDPEREMSKLHSIYAWGVVGVVAVSTFFLLLFGGENWYYLALIFLIIPLVSFILYSGSDIPDMPVPEKVSGVLSYMKNKSLWACFFAIFLGGASECTMAQWCSGYLEKALGISKVWGDIFGVALFAFMLGTGRSLYAKIGKNIRKVLFMGGISATVCYLTAAVCPNPIIGLIGCAFTGFCVSMLWPGCLVVASDRFPKGGVFIFALMAAGGDFGASVGPQLVGIVTDIAIENSYIVSFAETLLMSPDQLGMKIGMLVATLFPLFSIPLYFSIWKKDRNINHIC